MGEWLLAASIAWWMWIILLVIIWVSEANEAFLFGVFASILLCVSLYFGYIKTTEWWSWYYILAYLPVGLVYSGFRWWRYGQQLAERAEKHGRNCHITANDLNPKHQADRITNWILTWPVSILYWTLSDFVSMVTAVVKEKLAIFYSNLTTSAQARIDAAKK